MLLKKKDFQLALNELKEADQFSLDTETTGLFPYNGDRLFSIICATAHDTFYFNFNRSGIFDEELVLPRDLLALGFNDLLADKSKTIFLANAKFDMHMLAMEGVQFKSRPWDILTIAKTLDNTHMRYGLDDVAKREGFEKYDIVKQYIKENKLEHEGKPRYDWVPLEVMRTYAEQDARITFDLGVLQQEKAGFLECESKLKGQPSFLNLVDREIKTTQVCFEIEQVGMQTDEAFIKEGILRESTRAETARKRFLELSGREFVDSNKALGQAFGSLNLSGGRTKKGNPSFDKNSLRQIDHELARTVTDYRDANKRVSTYYKSFLSFADQSGVIHPNIRQAGAKTFRFSITAPALQTLEKPDEDLELPLETEMRNSFRAREGWYLVAIDYKQQEYRLTADYAGEMALIKKIMEGEDVHLATAQLMGVTRTQAKTLNFMLLYGGGVAKLCMSLLRPVGTEAQLKAMTLKYVYEMMLDPRKDGEAIGSLSTVTPEILAHDLPLLREAYTLQKKYFSSLPRIKNFMDRVKEKVKREKYVYNWAGRRLYFTDMRFAYKAPNHLIQSSGAEIMRCALIDLNEFLSPYKSRILLSIHDEILFEMVPEEFYLTPQIQEIMAQVYTPMNGCFMDTDLKSGKSWGALTKGLPVVQ